MLHAPGRAHQAQRIERHEGEVEPDEPAPEGGLAEPFVQREAKSLGEPVVVAREGAEHHAADDHIVKMRHQEQTVVQHKIRRRRRQHHAGHAADDKGDHEAYRPIDRDAETDAAPVEREEPVEHFHAGRHRDDHRHDAKEAVDVGASAHGEEMMKPHQEGEHADRHRGDDHRTAPEQRLARKGGNDLGENSERRENEDVDLGVAPGPDEVDIHHGVSTKLVGEEVEAEIAVQQQHREGPGQDREGGDDQEIGGERRPAEDRHAGIAHARRPHFQDRRRQVDPGQEGADARNLQRPEIVIDPDAGRVSQFRQGRIGEPAGLGEFAHHQRDVDQKDARGGDPEAYRIEHRKSDIANAELERHDEVHQADHEGHRHEKNHDRAMGRKNLVEVFRRQITLRAGRGDRLL